VSREWTRAQIEELLASRDLVYQDVKLPFGLSTGGADRSATARAILPADMTGKSVFDLGCMYGFFCFEAEQAGASRMLGVDIEAVNVETSRLLAEIRGSKAEFRKLDIEMEPIPGQFDYVLCLNVLHHMRNPLGALDKLIAATRERLVLEVASLGRGDRRKLSVPAWAGVLLRRFPIVYASSATGKRAGSNELFYFTPAAIQNLLTAHRRVFSKIEVLPSEHKDGRFIVIAHKRRVDRLIVVAGPTSSGKSTLIENLTAGKLPATARALGIADLADWADAGLTTLSEFDGSGKRNLILHYDITRRQFGNPIARSQYDLHDLISVSDRVDFLTIQAPPDRLRRQHAAAMAKPRPKALRSGASPKHKKIAEVYQRDAVIQSLYQEWFELTRRYPGDHYVVAASDSDTVSRRG
jgi:SAM-dependent methyltransferase